MRTTPRPNPGAPVAGAAPPALAPAPAGPAVGLAGAVLRALVYADLFDYPLTAPEIARYLVACPADPAALAAVLADDSALRARVDTRAGFYFLRGRADLVARRAARAVQAARLWRRARRYLPLLAGFPFVRTIAVTGALAVDNVDAGADIDLLVICAPGRVWICRRLLILAVRGIRLLGDEICPNFILAADDLNLAGRDLFTAHELAQMRPASGYAGYRALLAANPWLVGFLPNATPWPAPAPAGGRAAKAIQGLLEAPLRARLFDSWERWELARLRRRLGAPAADDEVACTPQQCKGHTGRYRAQVLQRFEHSIFNILNSIDPADLAGGGAAQAVAQGQAEAGGGWGVGDNEGDTGCVQGAQAREEAAGLAG